MTRAGDLWAMMHEQDVRTDPRSNVFLMAVLCAGPSDIPVRVRNLSPHGALLEAADLPEEGLAVRLRRGSLAIAGEIAWSRDQHCGIRFSQPIKVEEWIERAGPVGQQRIDAAIAAYRKSPTAPSNLAILEPERAPETLTLLTGQLLQTCERMAALPGMSLRLAEELLKIEAAARVIETLPARR